MWNRVELKNNAKQIMRKNYWWIVLLSVITAIAIGQGIRLNVIIVRVLWEEVPEVILTR